jgi:hypothetical protein
MIMKRTFEAALLLLISGAMAASTADRGVNRAKEWRERDTRKGVAQTLSIVRLAPDRQTSALLLEAAGERLVLTIESNPARGTIAKRITADDTGAWVELTQRYPLTAPTLAEWFPLFHEGRRSADLELELTVSTSGGTAFSIGRVPYIDAPPIAKTVARAQKDLLATLTQEVEKNFSPRVVAILDSVVRADDDGTGYLDLLDLLCSVQTRTRTAPPSLEIAERHNSVGVLLTDTRDIEFTKRFRSLVNPTDPVGDLK